VLARISLITVLTISWLIAGVVVAILLPPFQVPDEPEHWIEAYRRSENLFSPLSTIENICAPATSLPKYFDISRIAFNRDARVKQGIFGNLAEITPVCGKGLISYGINLTYPGVILSRLAVKGEGRTGRRALECFYFARIISGLLILLLFKIILEVLKNNTSVLGYSTIFSVLFAPLVIQQSFGVTADTICITFAILIVVHTITKPISNILEILLLIAISIVVATTKPPLLPLIIGTLLISILNSHLRKKHIISWSILSIILICLGSAWTMCKNHHPPAHQIAGRNINARKQLEFTLNNPAKVFMIVWNDTYKRLNFSNLGDNLGWLSLKLSDRTIQAWNNFVKFALILDLILFALTVKFWNGGIRHILMCISLFIISLCGALMMSLALYLAWSPVGSDQIHGLQGRYYHLSLIIALSAIVALFRGAVPNFKSNNTNIEKYVLVSFIPILFTSGLSISINLSIDIFARYW
jgi:uncharacterized membrane protein